MAVGDQGDILNRQVRVLPGWFPDISRAPVLGALLGGAAGAFAFCYSFLQQAALQTRIRTQTGGWLDMTAWDFFGGRFTRRVGEDDSSWGPRVIQEILRPRQTRAAVVQMLVDLTTKTPKIIELFNSGDVGGYDVYQMGGYDVGNVLYADLTPNQFLIEAYRSPSQGVPLVGGYDSYNAAYDVGIDEYVDMSQVRGKLTDAEIYARIAQTIAAGVSAWVDLHDGSAPIALTSDAGIALVSETTGAPLVVG